MHRGAASADGTWAFGKLFRPGLAANHYREVYYHAGANGARSALGWWWACVCVCAFCWRRGCFVRVHLRTLQKPRARARHKAWTFHRRSCYKRRALRGARRLPQHRGGMWMLCGVPRARGCNARVRGGVAHVWAGTRKFANGRSTCAARTITARQDPMLVLAHGARRFAATEIVARRALRIAWDFEALCLFGRARTVGAG